MFQKIYNRILFRYFRNISKKVFEIIISEFVSVIFVFAVVKCLRILNYFFATITNPPRGAHVIVFGSSVIFSIFQPLPPSPSKNA